VTVTKMYSRGDGLGSNGIPWVHFWSHWSIGTKHWNSVQYMTLQSFI